MSYRSEITIPVNRDPRTLEQRREDLLTNLEKTVSSHRTSSVSSSTTSTGGSQTTSQHSQQTMTSGGARNQMWDQEVSSWISESRRRWQEDIKRIRGDMFQLEPADNFGGMDDWPGFGNVGSGAMMGDFERQSTMMMQQMTSMQKQQGNGAPGAPMALQGQSSMDAYEMGEDGQLHYKVRFDATDFNPEDIKVTSSGNRLTVHAKQTKKTATSSSYREFSRTVDLPHSIDHERFQCNLTQDKVLVLDAPVKAPDYKSLTFREGLGVRAQSEKSGQKLAVTGASGPVVLPEGSGGRKLHLEIAVDSVYSPDDISVRTEGNRILISARHEVKTATSSSFKEFSKQYEIPESIDPLTLSAQLANGTLVVEAPLVCTV